MRRMKMKVHKSGARFPTGLDVGAERKCQNPPDKKGAGSPTHKKHRLGDLDNGIGAGVRRYNPRGQ